MAPVREVSYKTLKRMNKLKIKHNPEPKYGFIKGFVYVPSIKLYVEKESHLEENWDKYHDSPLEKKLRMLKIPEFIIFLKHVKDYDEKIYNNITWVRGPWRVEGLDAYFIKRKDGFYISTENRTNTEKLKPALMEDRQEPGISLDSWLKNSTLQGLPRPDIEEPNTKKDNVNYVHPTNNGVAGFEKRSDGIITLNCELNPSTTSTAPVFMIRGCFSLE